MEDPPDARPSNGLSTHRTPSEGRLEKTHDSSGRPMQAMARDCESNSKHCGGVHSNSQQAAKVSAEPRESTLRTLTLESALDGSRFGLGRYDSLASELSTQEPTSPLPFIGQKGSISSAGSEVCAVCFHEGPDINSKCCSAPFHCHCLVQWRAQNQTCPVCKAAQRLSVFHAVKQLDVPRVQSIPTPSQVAGKSRRRRHLGCCDAED